MVYDWEPHKDTISRLYVDQHKQVDDIIEYMRVNHGFTPSKRAYATQFRRWGLPSKHQPALKNDALVARVRELWGRNLSQAEMLRVLTAEGFTIKWRELNRVRSAHRWLLRSSSGLGAGDAETKRKRGESTEERTHAGGASLDGGGSGGGSGSVETTLLASDELGTPSPSPGPSGAGAGAGASQLALERRLRMEAESADRFASKKRRRRTRQYAGMPADPPGPPRFPSETTLAESQAILGLDRSAYTAVRDKFAAICAAAGIAKKTIAGPAAWEGAKADLVASFPRLQDVLWTGVGGRDDAPGERDRLALDVICSDVTKRMRAGGDKGLVLAEAKNILGLNPTESREVRSIFYEILRADGFTSKLAMGSERWKELKQRWIDGSEMLQKILSRLDDSHSYELKTKAVEALAADVMKRLRDDQSKRRGGKSGAGKAVADSTDDGGFDENTADMRGMGDDTTGFTTMLVPDQNPHGQGQGQGQGQGHAHTQRMLSNHLVDPQMSMQMPMDAAQLGAPLGLLDPSAQSPFMTPDQQFMPAPSPMGGAAPAASPFVDASQQAAAAAAAYQMSGGAAPGANLAPVPVYLRLVGHGGDIIAPAGGADVSIGFLSSAAATLEELRQVAAQKMPGSTCVEVVGVLKVPHGMGSSYVPLPIVDDGQIAAYLTHVGPSGPPVFNVRLSF